MVTGGTSVDEIRRMVYDNDTYVRVADVIHALEKTAESQVEQGLLSSAMCTAQLMDALNKLE